jgi:hypothetical protein
MEAKAEQAANEISLLLRLFSGDLAFIVILYFFAR